MKNRLKTELIAGYIKENNLSKSAFCKQCSIGLTTLNKILNGNDKIKIISLFKIARVMNKKFVELFCRE